MNRIRPRWLAARLDAALDALPVVVLTGPRQAGKTTLARSLPATRAFLSLDDLGVLAQARADPDSLLASPPLTLDEVQRVPDILLPLKRHVDQNRRPGDFLLTGSANLLLMSRVAESLAGRAVYLELPPFCPTEWTEREGRLDALDRLFEPGFTPAAWPADKGDWQHWLLRGGFPPALDATSDPSRDLWFTGYVQTYLERDLRQLSSVSSLPDFHRLMALAANRVGRLLNQSELARDAAMAQPTAHRHLNLLETGCLITRLAPYAANPSVGLVKTPKLFWTDCGLAAWLARIRSRRDLRARLDQGFWLEQTLFPSFQSWRSLDPAARKLHFWRDRSGREVDFVLEHQGRVVAVEVKASQRADPSDAQGIVAFREHLGAERHFCCGIILYGGTARLLGRGLYALPWGWLLPRTDDCGNGLARVP